MSSPAPNLPTIRLDIGAAMALLRAGRTITRDAWDQTGNDPRRLSDPRYLFFVPGPQPHIGAIWWRLLPRHSGHWTPSQDDLLATDWRALPPSEVV
ncbi:hypothetical protein V5F77_28425 [Xanthobacter sp. DSM 24535]|uniref:Thoeris anti-defense Tad2 family protein n=1 Tax=Roseixanthobacter psychrophilus TaxID=3119917 RepID=UPI00372B41C2